jgi:hypothetical protein
MLRQDFETGVAFRKSLHFLPLSYSGRYGHNNNINLTHFSVKILHSLEISAVFLYFTESKVVRSLLAPTVSYLQLQNSGQIKHSAITD